MPGRLLTYMPLRVDLHVGHQNPFIECPTIGKEINNPFNGIEKERKLLIRKRPMR